jgi:hypothetical protein
VRSTTVTVHWSAEAIGIEAIAITTSAEPAATTKILSFRPIDTLIRFLPRHSAQHALVAYGR